MVAVEVRLTTSGQNVDHPNSQAGSTGKVSAITAATNFHCRTSSTCMASSMLAILFSPDPLPINRSSKNKSGTRILRVTSRAERPCHPSAVCNYFLHQVFGNREAVPQIQGAAFVRGPKNHGMDILALNPIHCRRQQPRAHTASAIGFAHIKICEIGMLLGLGYGIRNLFDQLHPKVTYRSAVALADPASPGIPILEPLFHPAFTPRDKDLKRFLRFTERGAKLVAQTGERHGISQ